MRKLSLQQHVSLDGYILEEGTEFFRWWAALPDDGQAEAHLVNELRRAGTHIMSLTAKVRVLAKGVTAAPT